MVPDPTNQARALAGPGPARRPPPGVARPPGPGRDPGRAVNATGPGDSEPSLRGSFKF